MMTLKKFIAGIESIPATTSWYLADISEAKGKQELYKKQSPQRLNSLKEHALIESAVSSNRIEGVSEIWDAGKYQEKESDIIEKRMSGTSTVRFRTVAAKQTDKFMKNLHRAWDDEIKETRMHTIIALAAYNLDFLCIHPFRDGNGRVSRLLMLRVAHRQAQSLALHQLSLFHHQERLSGI